MGEGVDFGTVPEDTKCFVYPCNNWVSILYSFTEESTEAPKSYIAFLRLNVSGQSGT